MHDVATSTYPVGILCDHCMRRALMSAGSLTARRGDRRTLVEAGVHCSQCGSTRFEATLSTPRAGSNRYLDMAEQWAAEQGWHHWNAARWIRGLHRLDPRRDGFRAEDVVRVVQAWHGGDCEVWEGGFVVELRDGRRARLECFALLFDWSYQTRGIPTIASSKSAPTCPSYRTS